MLTDEQRAKIKTMPTNRAQIDDYNFLKACEFDLKEAQKTLEKRVRLIPGGWRDLRLITKVLENLLDNILLTFEPEKREHIKRNAERCQHKLIFGRPAVPQADDYLMSKKDTAMLIHAASKQCQLCLGTPQDCKQCDLGRTFDRISFVSRQNRAWWEVWERSKRTNIGTDPGYYGGSE